MPVCYRCHLPVPERSTGSWKQPSHESMNACIDALRAENEDLRQQIERGMECLRQARSDAESFAVNCQCLRRLLRD